jgi:hypothetical protein
MHSTGQGYPQKKNKEKDTRQNNITSKICLYDNTTTNIMRREKKKTSWAFSTHNAKIRIILYTFLNKRQPQLITLAV